MKRTSPVLMAVAGAILLAASQTAAAAAYIKFDGIDGSVLHAGRGGWIEIESYQWLAGAPNLSAVSPAAKGTGGPGTLRIVRRTGPPSVQLKRAFDSKTRTARVEFEFAVPNHPTAHIEVQLSNVMISGYTTSASIPTETLSLNFDKITWKYVEQRPPGSLKAAPAVKQ